jgi:hypothetical protein
MLESDKSFKASCIIARSRGSVRTSASIGFLDSRHGQPPTAFSSFATTGLGSLRTPQSFGAPGSTNCKIGSDDVLVSENWPGRSGIEARSWQIFGCPLTLLVTLRDRAILDAVRFGVQDSNLINLFGGGRPRPSRIWILTPVSYQPQLTLQDVVDGRISRDGNEETASELIYLRASSEVRIAPTIMDALVVFS